MAPAGAPDCLVQVFLPADVDTARELSRACIAAAAHAVASRAAGRSGPLETAREMGWEIVASDPEAGLIEATATTAVMNFKDDIAIRITETDTGAAVDVRSVSRVGISDLGANANRIRTYLHALRVKLGEEG